MALKVYAKIGFTKETQAYLHNDLAYLCYGRALLCTTDDVTRKDLLLKSIKSAKFAVFLKKNCHVYWNTLGLIASHAGMLQ